VPKQITSNITSFEDSGNTETQKTVSQLHTMFKGFNPYPVDSPTQLLTREVKIPMTPWGAGPSFFTYFDPLILLRQNSTVISSILGTYPTSSITPMFRYLRCGFRIRIKLNSTPYHQGCMIVGFVPPGVNPLLATDKFFASGCNPVLLSACNQDECVLELPFMSPTPHYDLLSNVLNKRPTFFLSLLNPLLTTSPNVPDVIAISCWVSMYDIELYGPLPQTITFKSQSSSVNKHAVNKEAQAKDESGISTKGLISKVAPIMKAVSFISNPVGMISEALESLDKPTSDSSLVYTVNRPARHHALVTGLDYGEPLSMYPSFNVSKGIDFESSDMRVVDYAKIPTLFATFTVTTETTVFSIPVHPMRYVYTISPFFGRNSTQPDYLAVATNGWNFWRGSIRYMFQFVGTPFYSCRFRISLWFGIAPVTTVSDGSQTYSKVVDVKGDTWTEVVVPYLARGLWSQTKFDYSNSNPDYTFITFEAITDVQGSSLPANAIYYVNMYRAAGSDFDLAGLDTCNKLDPGPSGFVSQCSLRAKFQETPKSIIDSVSGTIEKGMCMADTAGTISDMCKRFVLTNTDTSGGFHLSYPGEKSAFSYGPLHWWASGFAYWRGSRRLRRLVCQEFMYLKQGNGSDQVFPFSSPIAFSSSAQENSVVVPFYCTSLYRGNLGPCGGLAAVNYAFDSPVDAAIGDSEAWSVWMAAGDDFLYLYPVPYTVSPSTDLNVGKVSDNKIVGPEVPNVLVRGPQTQNDNRTFVITANKSYQKDAVRPITN
jgi:hypothetical protein